MSFQAISTDPPIQAHRNINIISTINLKHDDDQPPLALFTSINIQSSNIRYSLHCIIRPEFVFSFILAKVDITSGLSS